MSSANSQNSNSSQQSVIIFGPPESAGPTKGLNLRDFIAKLKAILKDSVKEAYIFGSVATGSFTSSSDLDLLLVAETSRGFFDRYKDFPEVYDITGALDLLIYTPQEFESKRLQAKSGFWKTVLDGAVRVV